RADRRRAVDGGVGADEHVVADGRVLANDGVVTGGELVADRAVGVDDGAVTDRRIVADHGGRGVGVVDVADGRAVVDGTVRTEACARLVAHRGSPGVGRPAVVPSDERVTGSVPAARPSSAVVSSVIWSVIRWRWVERSD